MERNTYEWGSYALEQKDLAEDLEALLSDIKGTLESHLFTDEAKLSLISKAIRKAGY